MTEEQKARKRFTRRQHRAAMTREQEAAYKRIKSEKEAARLAAMTPEQVKVLREKRAIYRASPPGRAARARLLNSAAYKERRRAWEYRYHRQPGPREKMREQRRSPERQSIELAGHLRRKYGLSLPDYEKMLTSQGKKCSLCGETNTKSRRLYVDHDHLTKRVRSLLCFHCNAGLGHFRDNPVLLRRSAAYIEQHDVLGGMW